MALNNKKTRTVKAPSYLDAMIPIFTLIVLVGASVAIFGLGAVNGPLQVGIIISTMITSMIILKNGHSWGIFLNLAAKGLPPYLAQSSFFSRLVH